MRENLIPFPYYNQSGYVSNGITYTINADGSVTANGTATAQSRFYFASMANNFKLEKGKRYLLSGRYSQGAYIDLAYYNGNTYAGKAVNTRDGDNLITTYTAEELNYDRFTVYIVIGSGVTVNNAVFYPSITKVFDYTQPKTDWTAEDYFNTTDYERIVGNIIETQDFASSLYSGYDIAEMMENVNYESIPHADNWNVISENIGIINHHTYNLPLEPNETYVDNGYSPNYEEFNRWETATERLMTTLRVEASTIPRLAKTLGRPMIGNR